MPLTLNYIVAILVIVLLPAPALAGSSPASSVQVEYVNADRFTDIGDAYNNTRDAYLEELRRHIVEHASGALPAGHTLSIAVTDIDRAGGFEPWRRGFENVRIVRDIYPPRIELTFKVVDADGEIVRAGKRALRDPTFLMTQPLRYRDTRLGFEQSLLDDWLERELRF